MSLTAGLSVRFNGTEIAVYRISVARKLGDYGTAVNFAREMNPQAITDVERRTRYWNDPALHAAVDWTSAFEALLAAERDVPEEVRCRSWAQQLTRDLPASPNSRCISGVPIFATRVGTA